MLTSVTGVILVACIVELLRRRKLKEKYAFLWVITGLVIIPLGFFPSLLDSVARAVGVASGVSLILFLSVAFLFIVCLQLSWEVGHLEEEGRTLSEEVALLRLDVRELRSQAAAAQEASAAEMADSGEQGAGK
ncbi:DUF2304 domain-containing protein [Streptomyces sp. NPDC053755]|uniref:DUF2304 domain-containing protein n=1 Tax=Streptomyces sp. NPDC053755 TaxID=3155815 RepID=UPI0034244550